MAEQFRITRGNIPVNEEGMTHVPGIFARDDTVNRTAEAISAIADGLRAVKGIDRCLCGAIKKK